MSSVTLRLQERASDFTASEKVIADWLQSNIDHLAFKPAAFIAEQCGVSEATVVRFARKLLYASYQELQESVQHFVQEQLTLRQRLQQTITTVREDYVLSSVFATKVQNVQHSLPRIDRDDYDQAVRHLATARKVGVVGLRASLSSASYLSYSLNLVRPGVVQLANSSYGPFGHLVDFSSEDAVVLVSVARAPDRKEDVIVCGAVEARHFLR